MSVQGGSTPSSTGPMSFLGGTPSPFHNTSSGRMSFPGQGTPVTGPRSFPRGVPQSRWGYRKMGYSPGQVGMGYSLARSGWSTPPPARIGYPLPGQVRVGPPPYRQVTLGQVMPQAVRLLWFPQEDCLVSNIYPHFGTFWI